MAKRLKILLLALPNDLNNPGDNLLLLQPLGLLGLSAVLKEDGFDVTLLDAAAYQMSGERILAYIEAFKPDVIGQTLYTFQIGQTMQLARKARERLPEMRYVVGGAHPSVEAANLLQGFPELDAAVIGEGEYTMRDLLRAWERGDDAADVRGLAWRNGEKVIVNEPRPFIADLDDLPMNDWCALPMNRYWYNWTVKKNYAAVTFSRGCPYHCIFCAKRVTGRKQRKRSPEKVLEELTTLYDIHGVRNCLIADSIFNLDRDWVREICRGMIAMKRPLLWGAQIRADKVDPETLALMKRAGCHKLFIGVESGDPQMLQAMRKGESIEDIREGVRMMAAEGIDADLGFIIGLPGETEESVQRTIAFAREFPNCQAAFNLASPYPGTQFYEMALDEGFQDVDWTDVSTYYDLSYTPQGIDRERLQELYKHAVKEAYLRPSFLWGQVKQLRSWTNFKIKLWMAYKIFWGRFRKLKTQAGN